MVRGVDDPRAAGSLDIGGRDRPGFALRNAQHRLLDVVGQGERQRFEVADDLVDVLHDTRNRLVLVYDAVDPEAPDGGAA